MPECYGAMTRSSICYKIKSGKGFHRVRDDGGRPEGDGGFTGRCRNRLWLPAGMRGSGEKFRRPGGAFRKGKKGEEERESRATYRCGRGVELVRK
jgi:hypothetical protein